MKCRVKPQGEDIPKIKESRTRQQLSPALHFQNDPHAWSVPHVKHKENVIMDLNICRSQDF
jgi:hypothetical protein